MLHLLIDILRNSILITGLVIIMMMMIESLNTESKGLIFKGLKNTRIGQVVIGALLGSIPGCMGGFATVSLYTHRMFSFGALVAMMIASSGDEAFMMIAMIPDKALVIFAILFVIAVIVGFIVDRIAGNRSKVNTDCHNYEIHDLEDKYSAGPGAGHEKKRSYGWKRISMLIGLALFIAALASGNLGHEHGPECHHHHGINLLSEDWMNIIFAGLSAILLVVSVSSSDHFVEEHLWDHIIRKHLLSIFLWTFGVLLVIGIGLEFVDISSWITSNTALMILLATVIGIIPESGPHLIFLTLYASGIVPLPVLLASSISQDGHASIPLLAESKKSFIWAKLINCAVALAVGYGSMLLM